MYNWTPEGYVQQLQQPAATQPATASRSRPAATQPAATTAAHTDYW